MSNSLDAATPKTSVPPNAKRIIRLALLSVVLLTLLLIAILISSERQHLQEQADAILTAQADQNDRLLSVMGSLLCSADEGEAAVADPSNAIRTVLAGYSSWRTGQPLELLKSNLSAPQKQKLHMSLVAMPLASISLIPVANEQVVLASRCPGVAGDGDGEWKIAELSHTQLIQLLTTNDSPALEFALAHPGNIHIGSDGSASTSGQQLASVPLSDTRWTMQIYERPGYLNNEIAHKLSAPLMLMLAISLAIMLLQRQLCRQEAAMTEAREQQRRAERRADLTLKSIDNALIATDAEGTVNYINPEARRLIEHQQHGEPVGRQLADIWPNSRALWCQELNLRELEALQDQGRTLMLDTGSRTLVLEQNYHPVYHEQTGELDGMVWLLRDISSAVRAQRELEASRQRYMALFEEAGVAHWLFDTARFDGSISSLSLVNVNQAAIDQSRAHNRAHLQNRFGDLFGNGGNELLSLISELREDQTRLVEGELTVQRFDGEYRCLSAHISSSFDSQLILSLIDVTEKKRATEHTREQEAFWSAVMAAMPDTVLVADLDDRLQPHIVYHNRSAAEALDYVDQTDKITRDTTFDWADYACDPDESHRIRSVLAMVRTLNEHSTCVHTGCYQDAAGIRRTIRFEFSVFQRDPHGRVNRFIASIRDVSGEMRKRQQIIDSESRYRMVTENMTDIVWSTDTELQITFVSSSIERLLGYSPQQLMTQGLGSIFDADEIRRLLREFMRRLKHSEGVADNRRSLLVQRDIQATSIDGQRFTLELQASLLWNDQNELEGILGVCRDVTIARANEQELLLAADVFENTNEGILVTDARMRIVKTNRAFEAITGFRDIDIIGRTPEYLLAPDHRQGEFVQPLLQSVLHDGYWQGEIRFRCSNDDVRTGWFGISMIRDQHEHLQSLTIILSDVTDRKVIEERIHRLAYFDALTGLANRTQLYERADLMMHMADPVGIHVALLFIDLDRFKPINDSLGHAAGDRILVQVADRLRLCVKTGDLVCRMGGDEFTICLMFRGDKEDWMEISRQVAERVLRSVNEPYYLDKHQLFLSASIGIAVYPTDADNVTELLKNADMAMYHAKDAGRNNLQFYDQEMNRRAVARMQLENDLHQVIARDELYLMFQPQFDSSTLEPTGVEALLRWQHPQRGDVPPQEFISILEDTGLIVPVGRWVLEQSCLQMARWQQQGSPIRLVAVNVSARQFKQPGFVEDVQHAIQQSGILAQYLELELTESLLIEDIDYTLTLLQELRTLGVRVAIDDFGTGYSSLNYLKQFPVDMLKIDKSFIQNLPGNRSDAQITRTIIAMAHNLGMTVLAEGVENCEQLEFLVRSRCEKIQGYLLSKPQLGDQLLEHLRDTKVCCKEELHSADKHLE